MSVIENSVWPNGLKEDDEGYAVFYPLGTNKIDITTVTWPDGDKLISPFVYKNDELVGFCDTKAMTVSGSATTTMNYSHIEADFSSISDGKLTVNAPNATVKKFSWSVVDSGDDNVIVTIKYKGCKNVDDIKAVDPNYLTNDIIDGVWSEGLGDLEDGSSMFKYNTNLTSFSSDLSSLTNGYRMILNCINLTSFSSDLPSLTNGESMFNACTALTSFTSNLSSLTNGKDMFNACTDLTSFSSDLPSLTNGRFMFSRCTNLTSFNSDLSSLTNGYYMFSDCKLYTQSVQNIADTINTYNGTIYIGIANSNPTNAEKTAFNAIASKGWTVYVNGSAYTPTSTSSVMTLDELGNEVETQIPYYAKPVEVSEEEAEFVDENGKFFNILGAQFIYGDDLSTYGMFTCLEDAAANMRLTKIERTR